MTKRIVRRLAFISLACICANSIAGQIYGPMAVLSSTFVDNPLYPIQNAFNQSGLSTPYASGVTNASGYNPVHTIFASGEWYTTTATTNGSVYLDMGQILNITDLRIWNAEGDNGAQTLTVYGSSNPSFSTVSNLGSFAIGQNPSGFNYFSQFVDVQDASVRYVRLDIVGAGGGFGGLAIGEIAFEATPIPEPGVHALLLVGLAFVWLRLGGRTFAHRSLSLR